MTSIRQMARDAVALTRLPRLTVNLMQAATRENDPFYGRVVREFYAASRRRHPKLPLLRAFAYGVAICPLPHSFEDYFMAIEASARRNVKKCQRHGYAFARIAYNDHLADIAAVRRSTDVRQGALPEAFLKEELSPCLDPPSRTALHDYPYFGVLKDGRLVAYAGGLVSGEVFMVEQMYGHAAYQADAVVPMLIIGMAQHLFEHYPSVKYYAYGTFFGAGVTLRRFKRKFGFLPHRVVWRLDGPSGGGRGDA